MDLYQQKLSKLEWESIEIPVNSQEKKILKFIKDSYGNVNNKYNDTLSLLNYIKIPNNDINNYHLYDKYFRKIIDGLIKKYNLAYTFKNNVKKKDKPKKIDLMKVENYESNKSNVSIFESVFVG